MLDWLGRFLSRQIQTIRPQLEIINFPPFVQPVSPEKFSFRVWLYNFAFLRFWREWAERRERGRRDVCCRCWLDFSNSFFFFLSSPCSLLLDSRELSLLHGWWESSTLSTVKVSLCLCGAIFHALNLCVSQGRRENLQNFVALSCLKLKGIFVDVKLSYSVAMMKFRARERENRHQKLALIVCNFAGSVYVFFAFKSRHESISVN